MSPDPHTLTGLPAGVGDSQLAALYADVCRLGRELLAASAQNATLAAELAAAREEVDRLRQAVERHQYIRHGAGDFTWVDEELWDALKPPKPPKPPAPAETPWCRHGYLRGNCGVCLDDAEGVRRGR